MGWTAPRTYVAGEIVTAAILNTDHRDNIALLRDDVFFSRCGGYQGAGTVAVDGAKHELDDRPLGAVDFNAAGATSWRLLTTFVMSGTGGVSTFIYTGYKRRLNNKPDAGVADTQLQSTFTNVTPGYQNWDSGWISADSDSGTNNWEWFTPVYEFDYATGAPSIDFLAMVLHVRNT